MHNSLRFSGVLTVLSLASAAPAQFSGLLPTTTFPSDHAPDLVGKALVNGFSRDVTYPYSGGVSRTMMVYDRQDLNLSNGRTLTHVGHQADPGRNSRGQKILLSMYMGATTRDHLTASGVFADNFTSGATGVFGGTGGKLVDLPNLGVSSAPNPDAPFVFVPLDTGFVYNAGQNLVIDWRVHANNNGNASFLYALDRASFLGTAATIGAGCPSSANKVPGLSNSKTAIGQTWTVGLTNAPASSPAVMAISLNSMAPLQHPGLAAGCNFHIDVGAVLLPILFSGQTNTGGNRSWSFRVPNDRAFNDLTLFTQCAIQDVFVQGGAVLSDASSSQLGMLPQQTMITASGNASATNGSLVRNWGMITHFIDR